MPYEKGEHVIYGSNGICFIEDIVLQQPAPGVKERLYYILRPEDSHSLTISVPAESEALVQKMRPVLSKAEIDALLSGAKGRELDWVEDKRARADYFRKILAEGVQEDLILMIRCIYLRREALKEHGKKLNVADDTTLKTAEKLVRDEFAYALSVPPDAVGRYIRKALAIKDSPPEDEL
ncbi:MAG: CarD family transcriptional regulator [Eubacteriales bacterium]|nr:CarD family transcriptional regulator [Eubacteriales bacterium]